MSLIWSVLGRAVERALDLPPALVRRIEVRRGLVVPAADGVPLPADLYLPVGVPNAPTVLVRSPYGRRTWIRFAVARPLAERGFQVLVQSCRGTADAGGEFDPFAAERADGLATLDWIEKQDWYNGRLLTYGPSYLGYVQWALAPDAGGRITAMCTHVTASQFRDFTYPGGSFTLRGTLTWSALLVRQREHGMVRAQLADVRQRGRVQAAFATLPLERADTAALGRRVPWFQEWLRHGEPGDPYWAPERDHRARVAEVVAPVTMVAGWHDIVLAGQLADYRALRAAGRRPRLTVGPWTHGQRAGVGAALREALAFFHAHATGTAAALPELPVRLHVQGAGEWRDYADWPPPGGREVAYFLWPGGGLATEPPGEGEPGRFRYDPADPTPNVGGPLLGPGGGPRDNAALEARPDVLVYSTEPLAAPVEAVGPVRAQIMVRPDREYCDVFVRLCDVDARGRSTNVCDGLRRVTPAEHPADAEGVRTVEVELAPTAYRFAAGHRIRVQVSGGAFPRYARNPGTGAPLATAGRLLPVEQRVHQDAGHPSALFLTV